MTRTPRSKESGTWGDADSTFMTTRRAGAYLGLSSPYAGRLPRERRGTRIPPLREQSALSQVRPGRVGGQTPGDHDSGGGRAGGGVRVIQAWPPVPRVAQQ